MEFQCFAGIVNFLTKSMEENLTLFNFAFYLLYTLDSHMLAE